jgi:hypothetical protein
MSGSGTLRPDPIVGIRAEHHWLIFAKPPRGAEERYAGWQAEMERVRHEGGELYLDIVCALEIFSERALR